MSDFIDECGEDLAAFGYETLRLEKFGATSNRLFIDSEEKSKRLGFERGHYFVINAPMLPLLMPEHEQMLEEELLKRLKFLIKENKIDRREKILYVGIGNPGIEADSFGVRVVEKIPLVAYKKSNRRLKIMPNIFANTGLNAYEIVRLIVEAFDVSAVLLFDSLATSSLSRLGTSLQINDAGLTPGSAMKSFGSAINRHTLNVPCIAVGVPMMISSKSLGEKREVILTDKDVSSQIEFLSTLISKVIDKAL